MATTSIARRHHHHRSSSWDRRHVSKRKSSATFRRSNVFYFSIVVIFFVIIGFYTHQLNTMGAAEIGDWAGRRTPDRRVPAPARFRPVDLVRRLEENGRRLDLLRSEGRVRVRPPRLALVVGSMNKDSQSLMLLTVVKGLRELGYIFTVYAIEDGEAHSLWEHVGCQVLVLQLESSSPIDWSNYEGVILSSLEARRVIASFMDHPFDSVPLVWLIREDILGRRLSSYESSGRKDLVTMWRSAFSRATVVVFPDLSLPMMYTSLDTGNFYVIPESPVNVWEAESYTIHHSRNQLRKDKGFDDSDLIILVFGSYFFYDELPWEYAAIMNALAPEIKRFTKMEGLRGKFKFVFLYEGSTVAYDSAFQELASHVGLPVDVVKHSGVDGDVNRVLLLADLVIYGSFPEEQSFPPLLVRAMSFEIPIMVPAMDIVTKYVVDHVHGLIFDPGDLSTLVKSFSLLIEDGHLSNLSRKVASSGKLLSKNMLALDCIVDYAKLLENVLQFPSDVLLPLSLSHIKQNTWAWDLLENENQHASNSVQHGSFRNNHTIQSHSIIDFLEEQETGKHQVQNNTQIVNESSAENFPTQLDWDILTEMAILEDTDRWEREEIAERMPRNLGEWDVVYNNARKADKNINFVTNERDEAELEKIGLQLCMYEIYSGEGAWPFLRHGSLYRGISLSKSAQRPSSDDVDAVGRLPILNDAYYRDLFCEFGAMFSIANEVDSIHNMPWIGFQSWHVAGRKVSLSIYTGKVLAQISQEKLKGDVIYYWAPMNMDQTDVVEDESVDFWSTCDILNAGHCRTVFEDAFRLMYGIPKDMAALPPMPDDGDQWSTLHSWVMPTPSFLEFMMFSRMFVDSIDDLNHNSSSSASCVLGSSELEARENSQTNISFSDAVIHMVQSHETFFTVAGIACAREMVYVDPATGEMNEQHPINQRIGNMWVKYFNSTLLKSMDEDLAEEADDGMNPNDRWLWPLTGEVHWPGIFDKEREDKYRRKMDKKRKNQEKILDRQNFGYKQKSLGRKR